MPNKIDPVNRSGAVARPPELSAEAVFEAVHSVMHLYRSEQYRSLRGGPNELTHMDGKVLGFFARHPGTTQKDLAAHSGRDKGQLARLVAGLKEKGWLDAQADEADRRNIRLRLTAEGKSAQQAAQRRARKLAEQAAAALTGDERRQLLALLDKIAGRLRDA